MRLLLRLLLLGGGQGAGRALNAGAKGDGLVLLVCSHGDVECFAQTVARVLGRRGVGPGRGRGECSKGKARRRGESESESESERGLELYSRSSMGWWR